MRTLVGAEGGVTSLVASVVSVTALLVVVLPLKSIALTVNVYVVDGVRCRRTTLRLAVPVQMLGDPGAVGEDAVGDDTRGVVVDRVPRQPDLRGASHAPREGRSRGQLSCLGSVVTVRMLLLPDLLRLRVDGGHVEGVRPAGAQPVDRVRRLPCGTVKRWPSLLTE